jgi:predicted O-methyltransferase YrrM
LTAFAKILGRTSYRRSRLHTLSGERLPATELPQFAVAALRRVKVVPDPPQPWMSHRAVAYLGRVLRPDQRLLELGSGYSTVWYAARVQEVVSLEDDAAWAEQAGSMIQRRNLGNARVVATPITIDVLRSYFHESWDVVVIDQNEHALSRPDSVEFVTRAPRPPSIVVLDDSDRAAYHPALRAAADDGWDVVRLPGYKSRPLAATETAVLIRRT